MGERARASYVSVGRAMRVSIEAALQASPELSAGTMRVLLVILHEVPSWSRLTDKLARKEIARRTGLTERTVTRAVNRLVTVGAIEWTPGDGAGNASQVALPIERETDTRPPYATAKGDRIGEKGGQSSVQKGGHRPAVNGASTRRSSEKTSEKDDAQSAKCTNTPNCVNGHVWNDATSKADPCPVCRPEAAAAIRRSAAQ